VVSSARTLLLALTTVFAVACADGKTGTGTDEDPAARTIAYDQAWQISTHNGYWVDRGTPNDFLASGVGERILDQLLLDGVRSIEIDIHADPHRPGSFNVFHTAPGNSLCATLADCMAMLRAFHHALPHHEVVTVVLELKGIVEPTLDPSHTADDLDGVLESELGALLYRPADLLARCAPGSAPAGTTADDIRSLSDCAAGAGWPSLADLRGRFLVTMLGNWDALGAAQATRDWVDYSTAAPIATRAIFPMASSWQLDRSALPPRLQDLVSQDDLDRAFAQSVFLQIEDLADPRIEPFLLRHGVIRVDGAFTAEDQATRIERGMQLLQTDFPWVTLDASGPTPPAPLRPLVQSAAGELREPGERIALTAPAAGDDGLVFASLAPRDVAPAMTWEATISSRAGAAGCLRAASAPDAGADALTVCRVKYPSGANAERIAIEVERCVAGTCTSSELPGSLAGLGGPGDLIALDVRDDASGRASCVVVRSTDTVALDGAPAWNDLGEPTCFATPLRFQGIARRAVSDGDSSPVTFFGLRLARGDATPSDLPPADFADVAILRPDATLPAPELLAQIASSAR